MIGSRLTMQRKQRVENCLVIGPPRGPLHDVADAFLWLLPEEIVKIVEYSIFAAYSELRLRYYHKDGIFEQEIPLVNTTPNYGGTRWWFLCPKCSLRISRLYKPLDACYFFCRHCHDLTYTSAQMSRDSTQKFLQATARDLGVTTREARRWFELNYDTPCIQEVQRPIINKGRDRRTGLALMVTKLARTKGLSV